MKKPIKVFKLDIETELVQITESYKLCLLNERSNEDYELEINENARGLELRSNNWNEGNY